jgi:hypothetical protein
MSRRAECSGGTKQGFGSAFDHVVGSAPTTLSGVSFEMGNFKSVSFFVSFLVMRLHYPGAV